MGEQRKKSRKPSAANSIGARPPDPVFFVDEGLGDYLVPGMLKDAGFLIERFVDHFPKGTPDTEWLTEVGKRGWVVLSKDKKIRKNALELAALEAAEVAVFILTSCSSTGVTMGQAFIKAHKRILSFLSKYERPFIATVTKDGVVKKYR